MVVHTVVCQALCLILVVVISQPPGALVLLVIRRPPGALALLSMASCQCMVARPVLLHSWSGHLFFELVSTGSVQQYTILLRSILQYIDKCGATDRQHLR